MKKRCSEEQIIQMLREAENARLKRLVAEQALAIQSLTVYILGIRNGFAESFIGRVPRRMLGGLPQPGGGTCSSGEPSAGVQRVRPLYSPQYLVAVQPGVKNAEIINAYGYVRFLELLRKE